MATITFDVSAAHLTRIAAAVGAHLSLGRPATGPEIKECVSAYLKSIVRREEETVAQRQAAAGITDITLT